MILTLTVNPAIDRNISVDKLVFEDRAYILATRESAGGRGINASCVLSNFGAETRAIAICGGKSGKLLEKFLSQCGYQHDLVPVRQGIRTNFTVADRQGLAVKLNEMGPRLSAGECARIEKAVEQRLPEAEWLMLCGSMPPGMSKDFYARLIHAARKANVRTLVDTDGEALDAALEAQPTVVTPNQQEAERLLSRVLITRNHFQEAASRIREMGAREVVLSLGARGAVVALEDGSLYEVVPPRVDAVCPIGAGDALAAAYVWAFRKTGDPVEATKWGVAAGTASARLPGVSFATLEQTTEIYGRLEVRRLA